MWTKMNSEKIKEAIEKVYLEIKNMSDEEFNRMIEKHKDGDYAKILKDIGYKFNERM